MNINDFHFIRPLWLMAIFALVLVIYLLKKYQSQQSAWQQLLPKHLAKMLIDNSSSKQPMSLTAPFFIGLLAIIALAGPTWKKLPQPVYQLQQGSVLIMDMSYSMLATDLSPNRLTRARYKANDLLDSLNQGEMGLIAYAGDAFVISPLTEDINNLKLLLPSLSPDIMPELGSNPMAALNLAAEMLSNSGHVKGNIYWFTDGIENDDVQDITEWSREHPYRLNILGIGSHNGAPIKLTDGKLMKDSSGAIIVPKLPESTLRGVASRGNGVYQSISTQTADVESLLSYAKSLLSGEKQESEDELSAGDQWQEAGPWLVLFLLPLVLYYFRRGTLLSLLPLICLVPSEPVTASVWQDLWETPDQQAQKKYNEQNYVQAAETFADNHWQGSAYFRAGAFEKAIEAFAKEDTAEAYYNQGNSHAYLDQLDQAIAAYDKALELNPDFEEAKANKALLEKRQEQEQKNKEQADPKDDPSEQGQDKQSDKGQSQEDPKGQPQQPDEQEAEQSEPSSDSASDEQSEPPSDSASDEQKGPNEQQNDEELGQVPPKDLAEQQSEPKEDKAQLAQDVSAQETEQKQQQLLNKVTDDPYLLLRNKMQLEYQKRRHEQSNSGVKKKW